MGGNGGIYVNQGSLILLRNSLFEDNTGEGSAIFGQPPATPSAPHSADGAADSFNMISSPIGSDGNIQHPPGFWTMRAEAGRRIST